MLIYNGALLKAEQVDFNYKNRGLNYGDGLFETMRTLGSNILFWEDHYHRLLSSMEVLKMDIPKEFTSKWLKNNISKLIHTQKIDASSYSIKILVWREADGKYTPDRNSKSSYIISCQSLKDYSYVYNTSFYELSLYSDFSVAISNLSNLKTTNRIINVLGSIYAKENEFDNCILLNDQKLVAEALNANVFIVNDYNIYTPNLKSGCINGIMRKQIINIINDNSEYTLIEKDINIDDLEKADEVFITNSIVGIQAISKFKESSFGFRVSEILYKELINTISKL